MGTFDYNISTGGKRLGFPDQMAQLKKIKSFGFSKRLCLKVIKQEREGGRHRTSGSGDSGEDTDSVLMCKQHTPV